MQTKATGEVFPGILAMKSSRCPAILRDPSCAVCCQLRLTSLTQAMNMTLCSTDFALQTSNENTDYTELTCIRHTKNKKLR